MINHGLDDLNRPKWQGQPKFSHAEVIFFECALEPGHRSDFGGGPTGTSGLGYRATRP
jgi:hypothetical protein